MVQGTSLRMRQVDSADMAVGGASGIQDALHDLRRLGQANGAGDDGLAYGTIAISQYRRQDGSQAWLVTIPGTDGQKDSPFGWIQNPRKVGEGRQASARPAACGADAGDDALMRPRGGFGRIGPIERSLGGPAIDASGHRKRADSDAGGHGVVHRERAHRPVTTLPA